MFQPLKKYADFTGRARRMEYWLFALLNMIFGLVALLLGGSESSLIIAVWLAFLIPNLAVGVRRLHDIDMCGWWILVSLIPFVGSLVMLVFALIPGTVGENRFGSDPKEEIFA